jgi:hypothetical protein
MNPSNYGNTTNYLVPAAGLTHYVSFSQVFSATPQNFDWRQFSIDNFPFQPQGAFVDNTQGTGDLVINIQPINYNVIVPAGVGAQVQFPAPDGQSVSITGSGQATVAFVDFPVLPNAGLVDIGNTVQVNISEITSGVVIPTAPAASAGGLPYLTQSVPSNTVCEYLTLSGATVTASVTPPANSNLRKLLLSITDNATLTTAGYNLVSVTLNGVTIFKENVYIPATAIGNSLKGYTRNITFDEFAPNTGAAGTLTITIGAALASGIIDVNAYFA